MCKLKITKKYHFVQKTKTDYISNNYIKPRVFKPRKTKIEKTTLNQQLQVYKAAIEIREDRLKRKGIARPDIVKS